MASDVIYRCTWANCPSTAAATTAAVDSEGTMTRTTERVSSASWLIDHANETRSAGAGGGGGGGASSTANWTDDVRGVSTGADSEARPPNWPVLFLFGVVVLTIAGNVLVCVAVCRNRKLQNMFNFFLVSLALSDTLSAILVMPLSIIRTFMGQYLFKKYIGLYVLGLRYFRFKQNKIKESN